MSSASRKRIVVVEDHPGLREQLAELLADAGHEVFVASDVRAARRLVDQKSPDLVCVDLVLPEGSGYELCEYIKATPALSATRVLVVSGRSLPTDRAFAEEAGADAFLSKPFAIEALMAAVNAQLAKPCLPAVEVAAAAQDSARKPEAA